MPILDRALEPPAYGWMDKDKNLIIPSLKEILREFFTRLNLFRNRKNWLPFFSWLKIFCLLPFLFIFFFKYFSFGILGIAFVYSMIIMGTHGTIWYHRYCTHQAYKFRNKFWRHFTRNLTISIIPEEIYVISHHVHHAKSDQPGDPYNASAGFLYCFLADVNHQPIARQLSEGDYDRLAVLMKHTGIKTNSYSQYLRWGSLVCPYRTVVGTVLNWSFWYGAFYLLGGNALACALFGAAGFWAIGVRTFNYEGHGKGRDRRKNGSDFNRKDLSINQLWPGFVAGEWHNNHHLYPSSARSGFLKYQIDLAWYYIRFMNILGAVSFYHDSKKLFLEQHHGPYLKNKK
ncbi:MAG: fatty acid desaturase [Puia sp.]|nr:fatty acid desaturase [Puia sp.]